LRAWPTKEFLDEFLVPEDEGGVIEFLRHDGWDLVYDWRNRFFPDVESNITIALSNSDSVRRFKRDQERLQEDRYATCLGIDVEDLPSELRIASAYHPRNPVLRPPRTRGAVHIMFRDVVSAVDIHPRVVLRRAEDFGSEHSEQFFTIHS
jgi:hypothetical protein